MADLAAEHVAELQELVPRTTLRSVEFHQYGARRTVSVEFEAGDEISGGVTLNVQHRFYDGGFSVRLVGKVEDPRGVIDVAVAADYGVDHGDLPSTRLLRIFANEVSLMTLFPYLREAVSSLSTRVYGSQVLLPTLERGAIPYDPADAETVQTELDENA